MNQADSATLILRLEALRPVLSQPDAASQLDVHRRYLAHHGARVSTPAHLEAP